ncbi:MAG: hydrogenase formation protein HypD [Deltaproteobacteria bacterium]|nr:hydrogenase formation protein HypD [Deltaproteobacteria bacterium]
MKYMDEFRRPAPAAAMVEAIKTLSAGRRGRLAGREIGIMEICGTHTHSISRYGIRAAMPQNIRLISGPGCPVCVTSQPDIDRLIHFVRREKKAIVATFGDMLRVPGSFSSLERERAEGAEIRVVYSPLDCLDIAAANPSKEVMFYSVGFETTAPTVAATIVEARRKGVKNLSVLSLHKLTPPAMRALVDAGDINIDGFIAPGHVTAVIGARAYGFLSEEYGLPCVVAGFEPLDALAGLWMLVKQLSEARRDIEIQYKRVVTWEGNRKAQAVLNDVFTEADAMWRGIGVIPGSGLKIREGFAAFDAEKRFDIGYDGCVVEEAHGCACGKVLKGLITPPECPLFQKACRPDAPQGPCMVSSEGTCAAYYRYERV